MKNLILIALLLLAGCAEKEVIVNKPDIEGCSSDSDCVPATCCHPDKCVLRENAPDCEREICTLNCAPNTMDCGGSCRCIEKQCIASLVR